MVISRKWGPLQGSPCNKDPSILGSVLGPLILGNSHMSYGQYFWYAKKTLIPYKVSSTALDIITILDPMSTLHMALSMILTVP